jgi:hypothetical protein
MEGMKKKKFKKNGTSPIGAGVDPHQLLVAGRGSTPGPIGLAPFLFIYLFFNYYVLEV